MKLDPNFAKTFDSFRRPRAGEGHLTAPRPLRAPEGGIFKLESSRGRVFEDGGTRRGQKGRGVEEGQNVLNQAVELSKGMDSYIERANELEGALLTKTGRGGGRSKTSMGSMRSRSKKRGVKHGEGIHGGDEAYMTHWIG